MKQMDASSISHLMSLKFNPFVAFVVGFTARGVVRVVEREALLLLCQLYKIVKLHHVRCLQALELLKVRNLSPKLQRGAIDERHNSRTSEGNPQIGELKIRGEMITVAVNIPSSRFSSATLSGLALRRCTASKIDFSVT